MKSNHVRLLLLPVIMIFITLSVTAQINSSVGYMHGTNKKGDTTAKSEYNADKAPKKDGADTTIIRRKATPASEARAEGRTESGTGAGTRTNGETTDTIPQSSGSAEPSGTSTTTTEETSISMVDCVSPMWRYAAFGFGILSLLLLLLLLLRNRKDDDNKPQGRV